MVRGPIGRHRRVEPVVVTLVLASGEQLTVPADSAMARAMGQVAAILAQW
jgi:hypothetical protein